MNSLKAVVRTANAGRMRNEVRLVPIARIARCAAAPATAPHGRRRDPEPAGEQDRAQR